jgi:hypothetical protein
MHNNNTSFKSSAPKPLTIGSPRPLSAKKGAHGASSSNQQPGDQSTDVNETYDKEVSVDHSNLDKKL